MRLDLYQAETAQIAREYAALLDEARQQMTASSTLSRLEQNGVLHTVQVLVENAIGKGKADNQSQRRARTRIGL